MSIRPHRLYQVCGQDVLGNCLSLDSLMWIRHPYLPEKTIEIVGAVVYVGNGVDLEELVFVMNLSDFDREFLHSCKIVSEYDLGITVRRREMI